MIIKYENEDFGAVVSVGDLIYCEYKHKQPRKKILFLVISKNKLKQYYCEGEYFDVSIQEVEFWESTQDYVFLVFVNETCHVFHTKSHL